MIVLNRRAFLTATGALGVVSALPRILGAGNSSSQVDLVQLMYAGGNWQPRPNALRRLAWELHKRTSIDTSLEPSHTKATIQGLSASPILYMAGDRSFQELDRQSCDALSRFLRLGGTMIIDAAYTEDGDSQGFSRSVDELMKCIMPRTEAVPILPGHLIFRTFYDIPRAYGKKEGSPGLKGYNIESRVAVLRGDHDMGGAWARDNLGNWEHEVVPGGDRQRENAFRLGINLVVYALCLDYKDEEPHRLVGKSAGV